MRRSMKYVMQRKLRILVVTSIVTYAWYKDLMNRVHNTAHTPANNSTLPDIDQALPLNKPLDGWIYEPRNLDYFWEKMGDRPFQRELYSEFAVFHSILDVGVRGYNRYCRDYIRAAAESIAVPQPQYYQMEPFPPDEQNNDGLLQCFMGEVMQKYPHMHQNFDLVVDFGVFGWNEVQKTFSANDAQQYVQSVAFLLKSGGMWILKVDKGWVVNQEQFISDFILPHFDMGNFGKWKSGHDLKKGKFLFYFFHKNENGNAPSY